MSPRPWILRIVLTAFAALLYYGAFAHWWLPRTISG
jgi:hypothetical protein